MPSRFLLRAPTLEAVRAKLAAEYGPDAVVISAEMVSVGGVAGLLATKYVEAVVEVPTPTLADAGRRDTNHRRAMAALLEDANGSDSLVPQSGGQAAAAPAGFNDFLDTLDRDTSAPLRTTSGVPLPAVGAGQIIVVAGLGQDGFLEACSIASAMGTTALIGGLAIGDGQRTDDRAGWLRARRDARNAGRPSIAGFGLGTDLRQVQGQLVHLQAMGADQIWLAVDARRKTEDTSAWVSAATAMVPVHALAVTGSSQTSTPQTVNMLGIPVGRVDGRPSKRPAL